MEGVVHCQLADITGEGGAARWLQSGALCEAARGGRLVGFSEAIKEQNCLVWASVHDHLVWVG